MYVSIITVTFNSALTIKDCIESIHTQSYPMIEHIIIDGASKDNTIEIIKSIPNRISKIISEHDRGIYDAMNKGINMASGEIIGILNSDDLYANENVIFRIVDEFTKDHSLAAIHTDLYYVKKNNIDSIVRHWRTGNFIQGSFLKGWHPAHPTLFLKKEVYEKCGIFDLDFKLAADFEFMLRIFEKCQIKSKYLPITTVKMRLGGATSKNFSNMYKGNIECINAFRKNGLNPSYLYPIYRLLPKFTQFFNKK